jgi:inorganic pyrophosphatase
MPNSMPTTEARVLGRLPALDDDGIVNAVIETPKGSRAKFKYDEKLAVLTFDKLLPLGFSFPYDLGFIPSTKGEDGDPLDVLLLLDFPLPMGTLVRSRLVGVIEAEQTEGDGRTVRNDRFLAVPAATSERAVPVSDLIFTELESFFVDYDRRFGKKFKPLRRGNAEAALQLVRMGQTAG